MNIAYLKEERGFMLAPTFALLMILLSLGLSHMRSNQHSAVVMRNDGESEKAFYIMEAGLQDALAELDQNANWTTGFSNKSFDGGSYTVTIASVLPYKEIRSTGSVTNSQAQAKGTLTVAVGADSFRYSIHSEKDVHLDPAVGTITGDVAVAENEHINESTVVVTGQVVEDSTDVVPAPNFTNWQAAADTVISGNYTFASGAYSGIWYVNGHATLSSNVVMTGTIVATGKIDFSNTSNITVTAGATRTALVAGDHVLGNSASNVAVTGVIYGDKGVSFNSQSTAVYTGSILGGDFHANSTTGITITYDATLLVNPPSYFDDSDGTGVAVIAWK